MAELWRFVDEGISVERVQVFVGEEFEYLSKKITPAACSSAVWVLFVITDRLQAFDSIFYPLSAPAGANQSLFSDNIHAIPAKVAK